MGVEGAPRRWAQGKQCKNMTETRLQDHDQDLN